MRPVLLSDTVHTDNFTAYNINNNNSNNGDTTETTEIEQVHPRNWKAKGLNGQLLLEEEMSYIESSHVKKS